MSKKKIDGDAPPVHPAVLAAKNPNAVAACCCAGSSPYSAKICPYRFAPSLCPYQAADKKDALKK